MKVKYLKMVLKRGKCTLNESGDWSSGMIPV